LKHVPKDFSLASKPAQFVEPAKSEPVVLTPTNDENDFLTSAFDKNVSADDVKSLAREKAPSLLKVLARPFFYLFALLEAGNVYAWLGVTLFVLFLGFELYVHRAKIFKLWEKLKAKFTS
jgi:hypothetical protein